jgi:cytochrome c oxidase subunit 1
MAGMPRRIADYPDAFAGWNMVSSLGAVVSLVGGLMFLYMLWDTLRNGVKAPANPWGVGATTLEWTVDSPAPFHTHEILPEIKAEPAGSHH